MKIGHVRIVNLLLLLILLYCSQWSYCCYIGVMHLSLEVLNRQPVYLQRAPKLYNAIFTAYQLVLVFRLRRLHFNADAEWFINCAEHLFFGIIICTKVYIYTAVFAGAKQLTRIKRALFAIFLFNGIGVANEIFQNSITHRMLWVFIPDSRKDLWMNATGAALFLLAAIWRVQWLNRRSQVVG